MGIFYRNPNLTNLLLDDYFREVIERCQASWRRVIAKAVEAGVPAPAFTAAQAFYRGTPIRPSRISFRQVRPSYCAASPHWRTGRPCTRSIENG